MRELDFSRITLRLKTKEDRKGGDQASEQVVAKREGDTLAVLQQCLVSYDSVQPAERSV